MGTFEGEFIRKSLDTTSWERGTQVIREWEDSLNVETATVQSAAERFLEDGNSRHLSADTLNKYRLIFREMTEFFGTKDLKAISVDDLSAYRSSWNMAPITSQKKLERLKAFFRFCKTRSWIKENRAVFLKTPKVSFKPTLPFTEEQFEKIIWATEVYPAKGIYGEFNRVRLRAFVKLLRYTGLRIRDAVCLKRSAVINEGGWRVFLYTQKTGQAVYIPIPENLGEALSEIGKPNEYLFWSGIGNPKSAVGDWQRSLRRLFRTAGVKGHAHMFRSTLAIDLLNNGVPLETVAVILGNSVKIAEKHYAPYVKSRQANVEAQIRKTWVSS